MTRTGLTAAALVLAGLQGSAASAQALLERVLGQIGGTTQVTGIFANTADNILIREITGMRTETTEVTTTETLPLTLEALLAGEAPGIDPSQVYIGDGFVGGSSRAVTVADYLTGIVDFDDIFPYYVVFGDPPPNSRVIAAQVPDGGGGTRPVYILGRANGTIQFDNFAARRVGEAEGLGPLALRDFDDRAPADFTRIDTEVITTEVALTELIAGRIDASVTNILTGPSLSTGTLAASAAASVGAAVGNIATTALGAVSTGDIALRGATLGLAESIDRVVGAASEAAQQRVALLATQAGATPGAVLVALNAALNQGAVDASVLTVVSGMDATIGRSGFEIALGDIAFTQVAGMEAQALAALTGGIGTTALGAVNTGAILSGAQTRIDGVIVAIVGPGAGGR